MLQFNKSFFSSSYFCNLKPTDYKILSLTHGEYDGRKWCVIFALYV